MIPPKDNQDRVEGRGPGQDDNNLNPERTADHSVAEGSLAPATTATEPALKCIFCKQRNANQGSEYKAPWWPESFVILGVCTPCLQTELPFEDAMQMAMSAIMAGEIAVQVPEGLLAEGAK